MCRLCGRRRGVMAYSYQDDNGTFTLPFPEALSGLYFPIASGDGLRSAFTPLLGGDAKTDQDHFLLQPVSVEDLHNNRSTRNFWCALSDGSVWSATGASASEAAARAEGKGEESSLTAGLMWQQTVRHSARTGLTSRIQAFVPVRQGNVEALLVTIQNDGVSPVTFTPYSAIPIYGRSADNLRDHRHVTSLLHRICTTRHSVLVHPTLSFDERGHQINDTTYFAAGFTGTGEAPEAFYPVAGDFVGEGGSYDCPRAVYGRLPGVPAGESAAGREAMGAMRFAQVSLAPGGSVSYVLLAGLTQGPWQEEALREALGTKEKALSALEETKAYWEEKVSIHYHTGDRDFDRFLHWVTFQPILRRIYGCSFLPHHDYGRGGRGWRDLWQDCLALLLLNPQGVKEMLLANFGGVRMDGTNATIIGNGPGEFLADRNHITRVWMDHGLWPLITVGQYIHQTGDLEFLCRENSYFKDGQIFRGTQIDPDFLPGEAPLQRDLSGGVYQGSVLEHLLVQNLTVFYDVGGHNHMLLRGADWNDALDMAAHQGESVAFTAAYAENLDTLASLIEAQKAQRGMEGFWVAAEMEVLFSDSEKLYDSPEEKRRLLASYCESCRHTLSGEKCYLRAEDAAESLRHKAAWIREHIRKTEWIEDGEDGWFNSYYDDHGRQVEGKTKEGVRMMLTGQVFAVMSGTATREQTAKITRSADRYLYRREVGGYRLNTDFKELKTDLGRMFGFAYGHKENGAVFSHMTTMYANALYRQGFAGEGHKALHTLYEQAADFEVSCIYPGIPEYFDDRGRGLYHYLTGAASWYVLTVVQEVFGVKGKFGALCLEPKLLAEQFDGEGRASIELTWGGRSLKIEYENRERKTCGAYRLGAVYLDGARLPEQEGAAVTAEQMRGLDKETRHEIFAELI